MTVSFFEQHLVPVDTLTERDALTSVPVGALAAVAEDRGIYQWDGAAWQVWREPAADGTLAGLADVDLTGAADGDTLVYDSGSGLWVPDAGGSGGGGSLTNAILRKSTNQGTGSGWVAVTWDVEDIDTLGAHESVTHPERLTAPVDGVYRIDAELATSGATYSRLKKNGATIIGSQKNGIGAPSGNVMWSNGIYLLAAGDYVTIDVYQNTTVYSYNGAADSLSQASMTLLETT